MLLVEALEPVEELLSFREPGDTFHIVYSEANELIRTGKVKIVCPLYLAYNEEQKQIFHDFLTCCELCSR